MQKQHNYLKHLKYCKLISKFNFVDNDSFGRYGTTNSEFCPVERVAEATAGGAEEARVQGETSPSFIRADGSLEYKYGVILNYLFALDKLEDIVNNQLTVHVVEKKIPFIDENSQLVSPTQPNDYKFELLVLDMIHMMDNNLAYEVVREKEFAPIKNLHGVDSVDSARELLKGNGIEL